MVLHREYPILFAFQTFYRVVQNVDKGPSQVCTHQAGRIHRIGNYINERILTLDRKKAVLSLDIYSAENEDAKAHSMQVRLVEQMGNWSSLSIMDKMSIVDSMIERICVTEEKVQIEWKI